MEIEEADIVKQREITFTDHHPDQNQAETAACMLMELDGVLQTSAVNSKLLKIEYNVLMISLEQIEDLLIETHFHLCSKLMYKMHHALYYYTEEIQRANNGCSDEDHNSTRNIFINRYEHRKHGCLDTRPEHWRKYL